MTGPRDIPEDSDRDAPDELAQLAERLEREHPIAGEGFRETLRRRLQRLEHDEAGASAPPPKR